MKSLRHPLQCESLARVLFGNEQQQNHTATPIPYRHDYNAQATFLAKLTDTDHTLTTSYVDLKSLRLSLSLSLSLCLSCLLDNVARQKSTSRRWRQPHDDIATYHHKTRYSATALARVAAGFYVSSIIERESYFADKLKTHKSVPFAEKARTARLRMHVCSESAAALCLRLHHLRTAFTQAQVWWVTKRLTSGTPWLPSSHFCHPVTPAAPSVKHSASPSVFWHVQQNRSLSSSHG